MKILVAEPLAKQGLEILRAPGHQVDEKIGLTPEQLADPAARLSVSTFEAVVERARALTGEPGLGFHAGMHMRVSSHGYLGFAAMTAGTVREALALAERFSVTRTTAIGLSTYVEGNVASLVIEERVPLDRLREFAVVSLLVGLWQIGQTLTGRPLGGVAECSFPAPAWMLPHPPAGARLRFSQPANRLVFDAAILDLPLSTSDPVAMQLARAQCERELATLVEAGSFLGRVRAAVPDADERPRSLDEVARRLYLSPRTLKRRLAEHGTSFSALVDELRHQRALVLLENRALSIADVADRLGYTEVANFTRAFRRWTGGTPAKFRRR